MGPWTFVNSLKRRSTVRLERDLDAARRRECECDSYHGFTCGKHDRIWAIETALKERATAAKGKR